MDINNIGSVDFGSLSTEEAKGFGFDVLFQEEDGTFDWIYSLNLMKKRSILRFIIMIIALLSIPFVIMGFFLAGDMRELLWFLGIVALCFGAAILIAVFANWLVNILYKGNYLLVYQMNDRELIFSQTTDQAQITRVISATSAAINAAGNNVGGVIAGTGLAIRPNAYHSEFSKVKSVKGNRKENLIWVNTFLQYQMVYVPDDFYDFVWNYITQRCTNAKIKEG